MVSVKHRRKKRAKSSGGLESGPNGTQNGLHLFVQVPLASVRLCVSHGPVRIGQGCEGVKRLFFFLVLLSFCLFGLSGMAWHGMTLALQPEIVRCLARRCVFAPFPFVLLFFASFFLRRVFSGFHRSGTSAWARCPSPVPMTEVLPEPAFWRHPLTEPLVKYMVSDFMTEMQRVANC